MSTIKKAPPTEKDTDGIVVSDKVRSYADDPYFVEKAEKAKAFLKKHPLPPHLRK